MPFLVECKPDQVMIATITGTSKKDIIHAGNKSGVIKRLVKRYQNSKGIVDEDPGRPRPRYMQRFKKFEEFEEYFIEVLCYQRRHNYLILLKPRLENWILRAASLSSVDVREYGLSNDPETLHSQIIFQIDKFEKLIKDLIQSRCLKFLAELLLSHP